MNSLPLVVNAKFLTQAVTGTQRFAINIALELKRQQPKTIFLAPPAIKNQQLAYDLEVKIIGSRNYHIYKKLRLPAGHFWEQFDLPRYLSQHGYPRLLNLANLAPFFYTNNVVTIHDIAFKLYPQFFSHRFAWFYNFLVPRLAHRARHIFTVSQFSKTELCRHLLIPAHKVSVVYNAADFKKLPQNPGSPYPWPYILSVGALEPRKNISRLITAFQKLPNKDLRLVIVGAGSPQIFGKMAELSSVNLVPTTTDSRIIFTGYLEDKELINLYAGAEVFCYPSLYEGFGLPPLEAQACGCPVLVSDRTSLPEIFGNSALYCNPEDIDDIAENLQILMDDQNLRAKLIRAGKKNWRRFNWINSTKKIVACVQKQGGLDFYKNRSLSLPNYLDEADSTHEVPKNSSRMPKVCIIVLNYNGWADTIECLESLLHCSYVNYQIVVVDNASNDDSLKYCKAWANGQLSLYLEPDNHLRYLSQPATTKTENFTCFQQAELDKSGSCTRIRATSEKIIFIEAKENQGYAAGNNIGLKWATLNDSFAYCWILNNDTVVARDCLEQMVNFAQDNDFAITGTTLRNYHKPYAIQSLGGHLNKFFGTSHPIRRKYELREKLDYIEGASFLISKKCLETIGFLPEEYFLFFEEVDYCFNTRHHCLQMGTALQATVFHKIKISPENQSAKLTSLECKDEKLDLLALENRIRFSRKYLDNRCGLKFGLVISALIRLQRKQFQQAWQIMRKTVES